MKVEQNQQDIEEAGNKALATLYGHIKDLNLERAAKFTEKVVSRSAYLPPERLPPTSDAGRFHSRRVYLQVQAWIGNNLKAEEWGWDLCTTQRGSILKPHRMNQDAAPTSLLQIVCCNCGGKCDKNTCSCRKNGLLCTLACGHCKGTICMNAQRPDPC